jgi:hypothetical protein
MGLGREMVFVGAGLKPRMAGRLQTSGLLTILRNFREVFNILTLFNKIFIRNLIFLRYIDERSARS